MSPVVESTAGPVTGFPRVSGDEPLTTENWNQLAEFSPRERG